VWFQELWVNTFHQGSIVVGKGGDNIMKINEKATASIGKALGKDVKLTLVVKSRKG
jgi:GTPase Era involved in 16S rRNA processing